MVPRTLIQRLLLFNNVSFVKNHPFPLNRVPFCLWPIFLVTSRTNLSNAMGSVHKPTWIPELVQIETTRGILRVKSRENSTHRFVVTVGSLLLHIVAKAWVAACVKSWSYLYPYMGDFHLDIMPRWLAWYIHLTRNKYFRRGKLINPTEPGNLNIFFSFRSPLHEISMEEIQTGHWWYLMPTESSVGVK